MSNSRGPKSRESRESRESRPGERARGESGLSRRSKCRSLSPPRHEDPPLPSLSGGASLNSRYSDLAPNPRPRGPAGTEAPPPGGGPLVESESALGPRGTSLDAEPLTESG